MIDVPLLLVAYNRPEKTARVLDAVRELAPRRLYVALDGPRPDRAGDAARCAGTRRVVEGVDWPCSVTTLARERHLGCKRAVETAVDWFLAEVEAGIILEDDCVPTQDLFPFCAELLERYRDTPEVMMIGGHNPLGRWERDGHGYLVSRTTPIWGWATWRRAWALYDPRMTGWADPAVRELVRARMPPTEFRVTAQRFDRVHAGRLDSWSFAWAFAMLSLGGCSLIPAVNLVTNIGFDGEATHTTRPSPHEANVPTYPLAFPLAHPSSLEPMDAFEHALFKHRFPLTRRAVGRLSARNQERVGVLVHALVSALRWPTHRF